MPPTSPSSDLALRIVQRLHNAGHIAYFAGGCVRDQLMNRPPKDYDVATNALPEQVLKLFPRSQKVGVAFGVVLVRERPGTGGGQVEVATFRYDGPYSDGRHPDSVRFTTPQEDAQRRDFTCNGLFLDPLTNTLHDFVGGQNDINAKTLRAIGNPHQRFAEDHLRMLRAIRFASRLGFTIEPQTQAAIDELQSRIELISRERIGEEIRMMLEHPARVAAINLLATFKEMFNEVFGFPPRTETTWPLLSDLPEKSSRPLALMAVLLDTQLPDPKSSIRTLRTRLMLSNEETDELLWLAEKLPTLETWESLSKASLKRTMANPHWPNLEALYRADPENASEILAFSERITSLQEEGVAPPPLITGAELINLGVTPGPQFKRWLDELYDRQLNGELLTSTEALAAAKSLITQK